MTLRHYAFSRQHRTPFSEDVYAFVLWRCIAVQIWRVKELSVPGIVASIINISCRESLYMYIIAFGYKKNNPARRAGEKNNFAPKLSEKKFLARKKIPSPPPPPPEYQMDRALCLQNIQSQTCFP